MKGRERRIIHCGHTGGKKKNRVQCDTHPIFRVITWHFDLNREIEMYRTTQSWSRCSPMSIDSVASWFLCLCKYRLTCCQNRMKSWPGSQLPLLAGIKALVFPFPNHEVSREIQLSWNTLFEWSCNPRERHECVFRTSYLCQITP